MKYLVIDAENLSEISLEYEIEAVPTFLFMKNKQQIGRLNGAHAPELTKLVSLKYKVKYLFSSEINITV